MGAAWQSNKGSKGLKSGSRMKNNEDFFNKKIIFPHPLAAKKPEGLTMKNATAAGTETKIKMVVRQAIFRGTRKPLQRRKTCLQPNILTNRTVRTCGSSDWHGTEFARTNHQEQKYHNDTPVETHATHPDPCE